MAATRRPRSFAALASGVAISTAAAAQPAPAGASAEPVTLAEIVVTARRETERLQDVPQSVSAVTSGSLQKLDILQFKDIQLVVPGLAGHQAQPGRDTAASLRGVTYDPNTGAQPTVAMYLNDASIPSFVLFTPLFDIGQIEVLRGPQGTTRGVSAPSGAITLTTHMPDLSQTGGYVDVTATDQNGRNVQGAINLPIIKNVLAVRAAGVLDQNDYDGVRSIHNSARSRQVTSSERVSVSFEPLETFRANVTYWHLDRTSHAFDQVSGPGQGGFLQPPITPDQRIAVEDGVSNDRTQFNVVVGQLDSRIFGQHLRYVGSYQHSRLHNREPTDAGGLVPGVELYQDFELQSEATTQEVRLASDPAPGRFFDYTVGAYYSWGTAMLRQSQAAVLLPGAFGPSPAADLAAFNPAYSIPVEFGLAGTTQETSLFGSATLHLGPKTELTAGVRHIWSVVDNRFQNTIGDGLLNLRAISLPADLPCSVLGFSAGPNPGDCVLPSASVANEQENRTSETPTIYNVVLSHHLTRDILVYASSGSSYRAPVASIGLEGALLSSTDPVLRTLSFHPSETSRSYEVGFKVMFLDGRARVNASAFRQTFHNLTIFVPNINYLDTAQDVVALQSLTASVDARVTGFDLDTAFQITPAWNVSAQLSYADAKVQGSLIPCNAPGPDGQFNTIDPTSGLALISLCPGGSASRLPLWNAVVQSEYDHPVATGMDGFIRALLTYYPENKNRVEPDFTVNPYSLLNLYAGVRAENGAWEVSLFARNALRTQRLLDQAPVAYGAPQLQAAFSNLIPNSGSGYFGTMVTPRREIGVNVRYAWGSR